MASTYDVDIRIRLKKEIRKALCPTYTVQAMEECMSDIDRILQESGSRFRYKILAILITSALVFCIIAALLDTPTALKDPLPGSDVPARITYTSHAPISIIGNAGFLDPNATTGIIRGSGTINDPYIIEGWDIDATSQVYAIYIDSTTLHFKIQDCNLHGATVAGVRLINVKNGTLLSNVCTMNEWGISVENSASINIRHNSIVWNTEDGISLYSCSNIIVNKNIISYSDWYGIELSSSSHITIINNNVESNSLRGIQIFTSCNYIDVIGNFINDNAGYGLIFDFSSQFNRIWNNYFVMNNGAFGSYDPAHIQACDNSAGNQWNSSGSSYVLGNYWVDWTIPDNDANGIIDNPYILAGGMNQDSYPLASPFPWSSHLPIRINNNVEFAEIALLEGWAGDGDQGTPYLISGYEICAGENHDAVYIGNTTTHFIVDDCLLYGTQYIGHGILLSNVTNGDLFGNGCSGNTYGIYLLYSDGNTVSNNNCSSNSYGIYLEHSDGNTVSNNNCSSNFRGFRLSSSSNNLLDSNNCSNNEGGIDLYFSSDNNNLSNNICLSNLNDGIYIWSSSNNTLFNNNCSDNWRGIFLSSTSVNTLSNNNYSNNAIGLRIYLSQSFQLNNDSCKSNSGDGIQIDQSNNAAIQNITIFNNNGGGIVLSFSNDILINGSYISSNSIGISIAPFCQNIEIANNNITSNLNQGVYLFESSLCSLSRNDISLNDEGINVTSCSNSMLSINNNSIKSNSNNGLIIRYSQDMDITRNNIIANYEGLVLKSSSNIDIARNRILSNLQDGIDSKSSNRIDMSLNNITSNGDDGIYLRSCSNNTIKQNNIALNAWSGIWLEISSNISIYHNNITNSPTKAYDDGGNENHWNGSYPIGGNYWSGYAGTDAYRGPNQDIPGSDGFGDTPYTIDGNSLDSYPLILPYVAMNTGPIASFTVAPTSGNITQIFFVDASASSDLDDALSLLEVKWDWEDNGTWTSWITLKTATHQYSAPGIYTIRLEVRDTGGLTNNSTKQIEVIIPTIPSAVTTLSIEVDGSSVVISWAPPQLDGGSEIIAYKIYRDVGNGMQLIAVLDGSARQFIDSPNLSPELFGNKIISYSISAVNSFGESARSDAVIANILVGIDYVSWFKIAFTLFSLAPLFIVIRRMLKKLRTQFIEMGKIREHLSSLFSNMTLPGFALYDGLESTNQDIEQLPTESESIEMETDKSLPSPNSSSHLQQTYSIDNAIKVNLKWMWEKVPIGFYNLLGNEKIYQLPNLIEFEIHNSSSQAIKMQFLIEIVDFTIIERKSIVIEGGNTLSIGFTPELKKDVFQYLQSQKRAAIHFRISRFNDGEKKESIICDETKEMTLLSYRDMIWSLDDHDFSPLICVWVTPHAPKIEELIRDASELKKGFSGTGGSMSGDQYGNIDIIEQLRAVFETLKVKHDIEYISTPLSFAPGVSQRIRLPREVLSDQSGNCIETTVTMASASEALGLKCSIVLFEDHAILGINLNDSYIGIETTYISAGDFGIAIEEGTDLLKEGGFNKIEIEEARKMGIEPME
jgi:parallel beta-helix repeat protein